MSNPVRRMFSKNVLRSAPTCAIVGAFLSYSSPSVHCIAAIHCFRKPIGEYHTHPSSMLIPTIRTIFTSEVNVKDIGKSSIILVHSIEERWKMKRRWSIFSSTEMSLSNVGQCSALMCLFGWSLRTSAHLPRCNFHSSRWNRLCENFSPTVDEERVHYNQRLLGSRWYLMFDERRRHHSTHLKPFRPQTQLRMEISSLESMRVRCSIFSFIFSPTSPDKITCSIIICEL